MNLIEATFWSITPLKCWPITKICGFWFPIYDSIAKSSMKRNGIGNDIARDNGQCPKKMPNWPNLNSIFYIFNNKLFNQTISYLIFLLILEIILPSHHKCLWGFQFIILPFNKSLIFIFQIFQFHFISSIFTFFVGVLIYFENDILPFLLLVEIIFYPGSLLSLLSWSYFYHLPHFTAFVIQSLLHCIIK